MNVWKVILATLVIFGAGVITGGFTVRLRQQALPARPPVRPAIPFTRQQHADLMQRMQENLQLTSEQSNRIDAILSQGQEHVQKLWEPVAPKVREETERVRKQIVQELTSEQQARFEKLGRGKAGLRPPGEQREERRKRQRLKSTNSEPSTNSSSNSPG